MKYCLFWFLFRFIYFILSYVSDRAAVMSPGLHRRQGPMFHSMDAWPVPLHGNNCLDLTIV